MLDVLPIIPLFHGLNAEQTAILLAAFEKFACAIDTVIFKQGDPADYLYLILKGRVAITFKPYDGPQIVVTRLKEGDVFGWSAVIGSKKYSSGVNCESALDAIRIRREVLWDMIKNHPETGKILIDRLALNVSPRWENAHDQIKPLIEQTERRGSEK